VRVIEAAQIPIYRLTVRSCLIVSPSIYGVATSIETVAHHRLAEGRVGHPVMSAKLH
jgi:hypothetical protein